MTEREFGNFSQWPYKDLVEKEKSFTVGDSRGAELRAEINRRDAQSNRRWLRVGIIAAVVTAFAALGLDRGIYMGSTSQINEGILWKNCRYLFVTGISEKPAHGPLWDFGMRGKQLAKDPDQLYCRLFSE